MLQIIVRMRQTYITPVAKETMTDKTSIICTSTGNSSSRSSKKDTSSSSRDDYARGVRDGGNARSRGGYDPGRNTSRAYQEGYRHGYDEGDW